MAGRTHVIIGDGLTAAEFAKTVRLPSGSLLYVIGPAVGQLGRGLAYADAPVSAVWKDAYLLNSPSEGVEPAFADWTFFNWERIAERMTGRQPDWLEAGAAYIARGDFGALNAPRAIYGDYLVGEAMAGLARQRDQGVEVRLVAAWVTDLKKTAAGFTIRLSSGATLNADSVDISPGGPGNQPLFDADGDRTFSQLYGNEEAIVARLKAGGALLCLGSNAAMLDALRLCQAALSEREVRLIALSPTALLPEPVIPTLPRLRASLDIEGPFDSAAALVAEIATRMAEAREAGHSMASIRGPFKAAIQRMGLGNLVPDLAEARKVLPQFDRLFLRGTRDSLADIHRLKDAGQIRFMAGRLVAHEAAGKALRVTIQPAGGGQEQLRVAAMVNCAGPGRRPVFDTLTENLLSWGWLRKCPVTGGIVVGDGLQAGPPGLRYLSPAVTVIGDVPLAFSLYDAADLKRAVALSNSPE